jgi:hypothetical protein
MKDHDFTRRRRPQRQPRRQPGLGASPQGNRPRRERSNASNGHGSRPCAPPRPAWVSVGAAVARRVAAPRRPLTDAVGRPALASRRPLETSAETARSRVQRADIESRRDAFGFGSRCNCPRDERCERAFFRRTTHVHQRTVVPASVAGFVAVPQRFFLRHCVDSGRWLLATRHPLMFSRTLSGRGHRRARRNHQALPTV